MTVLLFQSVFMVSGIGQSASKSFHLHEVCVSDNRPEAVPT